MWPWSKHPDSEPDNAGANRRRAERIQSAVLACDLGPIHDISASGIRVRMPRRPPLSDGQELHLELSAPTDGINVRARVVRVQPIGGGRFDVAIEFFEISDADAKAIDSLARYGRRTAPGAFANEERREKLVAALRLPDYYDILELSPTATTEEVHAAYRLMARKYHPDICREHGAHQRFCLINDAHSTLADPGRRAEYDTLHALRHAA
jgi:DnaJ-domain-containing protein 1